MSDSFNPVVIDLGKVKKKAIKSLKGGRGKLMEEVKQALQELREKLGQEATEKEVVPFVLIYRKKDKKKKTRSLFRF